MDQLLDHTDRNELFDLLLEWAKKQNPVKYQMHEPYHDEIKPDTSIGKKEFRWSTITELRELLVKHFDLIELKFFCTDFGGVDFENLHGQTKEEKAFALIDYVGRRGRLTELTDSLHETRPHINWPYIPETPHKRTPWSLTSRKSIPNKIVLILVVIITILAILTLLLELWLSIRDFSIPSSNETAFTSSTNTPDGIMKSTISPPPDLAKLPFEWLGQDLDNTAFRQVKEATFIINEDGLGLTGRTVQDRVWVDQTLPRNFKLTIAFKTSDPECILAIGLGDGQNWRPSYLLSLSNDLIWLDKYIIQDDFQHMIARTLEGWVKPNQINHIVFERDNGALRANINQEGLFEVRQNSDIEMTQVNNYNQLFFAVFNGGCSTKTDMFINSFSLETLR
jgi:hypothetical protein